MLKLIRSATGNTDMSKTFEAIVEIDETYVGGKSRKDNHSDDDNNFPKPPADVELVKRLLSVLKTQFQTRLRCRLFA
jgi:hypothetical protein